MRLAITAIGLSMLVILGGCGTWGSCGPTESCSPCCSRAPAGACVLSECCNSLSGGTYKVRAGEDSMHILPDVRGMTHDEAIATLCQNFDAIHCVACYDEHHQHHHYHYQWAKVSAMCPAPGSLYPPEELITLTYDSYKQP